jgi:hypothetical protein
VLLASLVVLLLSPQQLPSCSDVEVCRAEALIAHAKKDYEAFHDLAWAAYNKGRKNDPELMLLVARAQSLSGRPGDALVMLERIAALGGSTDALTSEDFVKVRALARWGEVEERLTGAPTAATPETPKTDPPKPETPKAETPKPEPPKPDPSKAEPPKMATPKPELPKPEASKPEGGKSKRTKPEAAKPEPAKPEPAKPEPAKPEPAKPEPAKPAAAVAKTSRDAGAPLKFSTLLSPSALAYDAVSKRFIIADREARRVAVIDENTGQVSTLVGAQGALGDVGGIAIDARQGDLWVVSAGENGAVLHKTQLISGRVLLTRPLEAITAAVVGLTFVRDNGLVAADAEGTLWKIAASGKAEKIGALEYVPRVLASDALGRLYVSAGGPRLARFSVGSGLRRLGVVELDDGIPTDVPLVVGADRLHAIVRVNGEYEIRSMKLR